MSTIRVFATSLSNPRVILAEKTMTALEAVDLITELQRLIVPPHLSAAKGSPRRFGLLMAQGLGSTGLSDKLDRTNVRLEGARVFNYTFEPVGNDDTDFRRLLALVRRQYDE